MAGELERDHKPTPHRRHTIIRCPQKKAPLFDVVDGGIEVKCRSCRGILHYISRAILEQIWTALAQGRDPFAEEPGT